MIGVRPIFLWSIPALLLLVSAVEGESRYKKAYISMDPCSIESITASMGRKPDDFSPEERKEMVEWCRGEYQMEKQVAKRSGAAAGAARLTAVPKEQRIWCGHNNCFCWKGPKYNGCHHTDKLCGTPLKCIGRVCGCTVKD